MANVIFNKCLCVRLGNIHFCFFKFYISFFAYNHIGNSRAKKCSWHKRGSRAHGIYGNTCRSVRLTRLHQIYLRFYIISKDMVNLSERTCAIIKRHFKLKQYSHWNFVSFVILHAALPLLGER